MVGCEYSVTDVEVMIKRGIAVHKSCVGVIILSRKKFTNGELFSVARSTGFEPAISSVTGRRDNPFTTSANLHNHSRETMLVQEVMCYNSGGLKLAAIAQLVERRFRKA